MADYIPRLTNAVVGNKGRLTRASPCPVIKEGTQVEVLHVFEFPAANTIFITIKDLENTNVDRYGKPEPIISTIKW